MGRGGARAKASGGSISQDDPFSNKQLSLNVTLFQFLQSGYFEKDLLSYCANRLAEYSCVYWLDPTVVGDGETVELRPKLHDTDPFTLGELNAS
ncbi:hypothetical protein P879_11795 [Paragonimus westermani]|uniref:Uncharacterized protein n=1 Tax=Paragonimus westermani TaxID=34504 RepID=A0A8T0D7J4_9TREM|nr:hypothetical protein P879_11795 [Paragonimus westermani]